MSNTIKVILASLASLFSFLFGNFDFLLKALLALMVIDYITGLCKAFIQKKINSSVGGEGIIKKVVYLSMVTVSVIIDQLLESSGTIRLIVITSFIINEILSILENSSEMGIKVPKVLNEALEKISKKINK